MLQLASIVKTPPRRSDSLGVPNNNNKNAIFLAIGDDLRDARRVYSDGQEEDLRLALSRVINRVEELVSLTVFQQL